MKTLILSGFTPLIQFTRVPDNILISKTLDKSTLSKLSDGGTVLLFPDFNDIKDLTVGGLFYA